MSSSKRSAGSDLNHDNWNDDQEAEDAGEFRKATDDELQRRIRKVARRRITPGDSSDAPPNANPFSGFGGFKANTGFGSSMPASGASGFGFLAKLSAATPIIPKTNGTSTSTEASTKTDKDNIQIEYLSKVRSLNQTFVGFIKLHVEKTPLCNLTPALRDYEKFMQEIEEHKKKREKDEATAKPKEPEPKPPVITSTFSFGIPSAPVSSATSSTDNSGSSNSIFTNFKFGSDAQKSSQSPPKPATASHGITFGSGAINSQPSAMSSTFSFGLNNPLAASTPFGGGLGTTSTGFSFGNTIPTPAFDAPKESTEEDADEEPPKNDFVPVVEDEALYTKRCKVFVKGASDFADRGVGTLYIKKVGDSNKIQMIVRADTNMGNILFNIVIADGLPASRLGKNNVMIVCVPTPDAKPPPTSCLLRVKTPEEADELLATIEKYKKN